MKATIRHVINPPIETPKTLRERILNSISPIDNGNYDSSSQNFDSSSGSLTSSLSSSFNGPVTVNGNAHTNANANGVPPTPSSSSLSGILDTSHKIELMELHPCQPLLCYVDTNGYGIIDNENSSSDGIGNSNSSNNNSKSSQNGAQQSNSSMSVDGSARSTISVSSNSSAAGSSSIANANNHHSNSQPFSNIKATKNSQQLQVLKQRIILQNHISNNTIAIIPILDVFRSLIRQMNHDNDRDDDNDMTTHTQMIQKCQKFGLITSIQFMDLHVLQHQSGLTPNKDHRNSPPYLIIHFQNRVLLYPIGSIMSNNSIDTSTSGISNENEIIDNYINEDNNNNNETAKTNNSINRDNMSDTIIEISNHTFDYKANITSKRIIPILSTNLLAIGCSDGAVRFYSKWDRKIVKSVRGPNGKNDPIVGILSINPWDWSSAVMEDYESEEKLEKAEEERRKKSSFTTPMTPTRGANDKGNGNTSPNVSGKSNANANAKVESSSTKAYNTRIMTICASGTAYLWELQVSFVESSGCVRKFNLRPPLVKLDCPSALSTAIGSNSNNSLMSPSSLMMNQNGTFHQRSCDNLKYDSNRELLFWTVQPLYNSTLSKSYVFIWSFSTERITASQRAPKLGKKSDGAQQNTPLHYPMSVIQIPNGDFVLSDTTMISGFVDSSFPGEAYTCLAVSKGGNLSWIASSCRQVANSSMFNINDDAVVYHYFNFLSMQRAADEKVLGNLRYIKEGKLRITKIASSNSRPDIIVMASNVGLIVVTLNDEDILTTGSIHACFSSAKANSNGFIGAGNKILLVNNSSVYRATLDFTPTHMMPNPIGNLSYQEMVLFYRSPPALHRSIEFRARPVRISPRLLPSPSGNFLCLFWHSENRYEIIHNSSITSAARKSTRDDGPEYSPAVDTGGNVLSFAWVGDEDVFALLYPPELIKNDSGAVPLKKKNKARLDKEDDDEDDGPIDPSKYKPRVELKVLVGVNKDAVEFSSSVAAATATFLGTLSLRGRHPPTCLFGGPVLCVGSLSQDKESSQMDGMAYFYCRRIDSDENDNRASSFTSVGPALPFPDLVVWDEDGKICAIIVGRRIALYFADQPNFTLLSTAYLGTTSETDAKVQSAKFLHGVLYCTTQSSVQCIFLGDVENTDVVCELDGAVSLVNDYERN